MSDLELQKPLKKGDKQGQVRLIQEWLSLHGFHLMIDGDFGPATEESVKEFQRAASLPAMGTIDPVTFNRLIAPMKAAIAPIYQHGRSVGQLVVDYARQHLAQHPREIGGQNRGPWVRLYMAGNEGQEWAWCAGFACFCLKQACDSLGQQLPIATSFSCDALAQSARNKGRLLEQPASANRKKVTAGSFFLVRKTSTDWTHTGIVSEAGSDTMKTIEGNTNDDGSREGYEVCARIRGYNSMDFIII